MTNKKILSEEFIFDTDDDDNSIQNKIKLETQEPTFLNIPNEIFYKDIINERKIFEKFYNKIFQNDIIKFLEHINTEINNKYRDNAIIWVGGSRSWNKLFECEFNDYPINELERASISAGNNDVFILSNNKLINEEIVCYINEYFDNFFNAFNESYLSNDYKLTRIYANIKYKRSETTTCSLLYPTEKEHCVYFPCQSLEIYTKSKNIKKNKMYKEYQNFRKSKNFDENVKIFNVNDNEYPLIFENKTQSKIRHTQRDSNEYRQPLNEH